MNPVNLDELEKSASYLLESLADILAVGGAPFTPALEELNKLLGSDPKRVLDPEFVKRQAFNLANSFSEIKARVASGSVEVRSASPGQMRDKDRPAPAASFSDKTQKILISIIKFIVSLRPEHYQAEVDRLVKLVESEAPLDDILTKILDLVLQVREDLWEERSLAFQRIGEILQTLEATERDFISSIDSSQAYLAASEKSFTENMEEGLMEISALARPREMGLEELCRQISEKVSKLRDCVQYKKLAEQHRMQSLSAEKQNAEKRLVKSQRDYDDFSRQSHEMLQEIENLRAVSLRDPLTEIYNRRAYDNQIVKTLSAFRAQGLRTCSIAVFDIDNFRDFNNTYGHLAGDRILAYVARLTREALRKDDLIFRYGGDEFVILMPNANLEAAMGVAEKVRRHITAVEFKLFKNNDHTVRVTVSVGVAEIKLDDDPSSFFARADKAMYQSKASGRNRVSALP
ncbi:MAG: diguanylate cyclase [Candidatus Adiutrix sp.]|jgi:diguanylate cyclase|nr:diguanylate cyclase [Candidatus Adiutrix sp.]